MNDEIGWLMLASGYLLVLVPIFIFYRYRLKMTASSLWAVARMSAQLVLAGVYLQYIFVLNNIWLNLLWLMVMFTAAAFTMLKRTDLKIRHFFLPVFFSFLAGILSTLFYLLVVSLQLPDPFDARYLIPLSGMIAGNSLKSTITGFRSFYQKLLAEEDYYRYLLAAGASREEALLPFMQQALHDAIHPTLAAIATMGIIFLPGFMTGNILSGSDPLNAVKFQILIMLGVFSSIALTAYLGIRAVCRRIFDDYDMPDHSHFN